MIRLTRNLNNFENILTAAAEGLFVVSTFYYLLNNLAILKVVCWNEVQKTGLAKIIFLRYIVNSELFFFRKTDVASSSEMRGMQLTLSPSSSPSSPSHSGLPGFHRLQLYRCKCPLFCRFVIVSDMTKTIGRTRGNAFVPIERSQKINMYYDYAVSITVFTSILKFCRF